MKTKLLLLSSITLGLMTGLAACAPADRSPAGESGLASGVVYGSDDRRDLYQVSDPRLLRLAASTVALVKDGALNAQPGGFTLAGKNFGEEYGLCANEPFRDQQASAFCSGSLVGPDLILTAGHCIRTADDCASTSFVFGFAVTAPGATKTSFAANDVYHCGAIVAREEKSTGADYALIKLDRAVVGREPLEVRRQGEVSLGQGLVVIGHPSGLPSKIAGGGIVRGVASPDFFVSNLDTYGGNSGSAVFNADTGVIEGILVRGDTDFQRVGGCVASVLRPADGGRGEDVTRISKVKDLIPVSGGAPTQPVPQPQVFNVRPLLAIPDNNRIGVSAALNVTAAAQGRKVLVEVKIQHTYIGDLVVTLVSPDGQRVLLHNRAGGSRQNLVGVYGRDAVSAQAFKVFAQAPAGAWKLEAQDLAARDVGVIESFSLAFE